MILWLKRFFFLNFCRKKIRKVYTPYDISNNGKYIEYEQNANIWNGNNKEDVEYLKG